MRTLLLGLCLVTVTLAMGQGILEFKTSTYNFETIKEDEGVKSAVFHYRNTGTKPVKLYSVKGSCGCTTSGWTDELIQPGDTGRILVNYNPLNRPGRFKKSVSVNSNASNNQVILTIEGFVEPKPKSPTETFTVKQGGIWTKQKSLNFGKVTTEKPITKEFEYYNGSGQRIIFKRNATKAPDYLEVKLSSDTIEAQKIGKIVITLIPEKAPRLGFTSENIQLVTNESVDPIKELYVIYTLEEYFPPLDNPDKIPVLAFDKSVIDLGLINPNTEIEAHFNISNLGKADLLIREIQTNCGCTKVKSSPERIKPGQSASLVIAFNSAGRKGRQIKNVTVFSNDPAAPTQTVTVKAEIR